MSDDNRLDFVIAEVRRLAIVVESLAPSERGVLRTAAAEIGRLRSENETLRSEREADCAAGIRRTGQLMATEKECAHLRTENEALRAIYLPLSVRHGGPEGLARYYRRTRGFIQGLQAQAAARDARIAELEARCEVLVQARCCREVRGLCSHGRTRRS